MFEATDDYPGLFLQVTVGIGLKKGSMGLPSVCFLSKYIGDIRVENHHRSKQQVFTSFG